jgi:hypothetical protein
MYVKIKIDHNLLLERWWKIIHDTEFRYKLENMTLPKIKQSDFVNNQSLIFDVTKTLYQNNINNII